MWVSKLPASAMVRRRCAALDIAALCPMPRSQGLIQFMGARMISYAISPGKLILVGVSHRAPACAMLCIKSRTGPGCALFFSALARSGVAPSALFCASTICLPLLLVLGLLVCMPVAVGSPTSVGNA